MWTTDTIVFESGLNCATESKQPRRTVCKNGCYYVDEINLALFYTGYLVIRSESNNYK